jgi:hypothetical protein
MTAGRVRGIPAPLARGRDCFRDWRRTRNRGTRIPDALWKLAARLAAAHGLARTASVLKLDYYALKKRVDSRNAETRPLAAAFIELTAPSVGQTAECVIELEDGVGARMRVQLKGYDAPDLRALSRSFWSGE